MSTFLSVPREIRDNIYLFVLLSESPAPTPPWLRRSEPPQHEYDKFVGISYPLAPPPLASYALLLACRQVSAEVQDIISILKNTVPLRYKIDAVFDGQNFSYWTWVSMPYFSLHIDIVDVELRFFGAILTDDPERQVGEYTSDNRLTRQLYVLLFRFMEHGPRFLAPKARSELQMRVMNVNIPRTNEIHLPNMKSVEIDRSGFSPTLGRPSPESVSYEIYSDLRVFNRPDYDLSENIERINILVDGKLQHEWERQSRI